MGDDLRQLTLSQNKPVNWSVIPALVIGLKPKFAHLCRGQRNLRVPIALHLLASQETIFYVED